MECVPLCSSWVKFIKTRRFTRQSFKIISTVFENFKKTGNLKLQGVAIHNIAGIYLRRGDLDDAMEMSQQCLRILEAIGDPDDISATLHQMAKILDIQGNSDEAIKLCDQSFEISEMLGDLQGKSNILHTKAIYI